MKFDCECTECKHEFIKDIEEYGETNITCPECEAKLIVLYSEDCIEDYSECWDSYWIELRE